MELKDVIESRRLSRLCACPSPASLASSELCCNHPASGRQSQCCGVAASGLRWPVAAGAPEAEDGPGGEVRDGGGGGGVRRGGEAAQPAGRCRRRRPLSVLDRRGTGAQWGASCEGTAPVPTLNRAALFKWGLWRLGSAIGTGICRIAAASSQQSQPRPLAVVNVLIAVQWNGRRVHIHTFDSTHLTDLRSAGAGRIRRKADPARGGSRGLPR